MISDHHDHQAVLRPPAAPTLIHTFGHLRATRAGEPLPFSGSGVGPNQLRRQLAFLLFRHGRRAYRDELIIVAGQKKEIRQRPGYVVSGLCTMLRQWGMADALLVRGDYLLLHRHPSWRTDGDLLKERLDLAREREQAGDIVGAIAWLSAAVELCNGKYLEDVDGDMSFPRLADDISAWCAYQRDAMARLVVLTLRGGDQHQRGRSLEIAGKLVRHCGAIRAEDYELAAEAAELAGNQRLAANYREKARRARGPRA